MIKQICKNCVHFRIQTKLYGLCFLDDLLLAVANDDTCEEWEPIGGDCCNCEIDCT